MVVRKSNDEGVVYINKQYLTEKTGEESNIIATKYCTVVSNTRKIMKLIARKSCNAVAPGRTTQLKALIFHKSGF